jgi:hypothetical protein
MKTHPSAQTLGFFDLELRVQWLAAAQRGGDWVDQPGLQPGVSRTVCAVEAAATNRRLNGEDQNQKRPKTN